MTKDDAFRVALETADGILNSDWRNWQELSSPEEFERWVKARANHMAIALRQALDQLPDTTKMIDTGIDRGAWSDVPDATKWVDELRGDDDGLPTDAQIIAGAIYDFAGFLTTRDKVIKVGASALASPVADLVNEWADMRGLSLEGAAVSWWQDVLEEPPNSTTDVVEPVAWIVPDYGFLFPSEDSAQRYLDNIESNAAPTPLYTAPPKPDLLNQTCCECGKSGGYALYCGDCWNKSKL